MNMMFYIQNENSQCGIQLGLPINKRFHHCHNIKKEALRNMTVLDIKVATWNT